MNIVVYIYSKLQCMPMHASEFNNSLGLMYATTENWWKIKYLFLLNWKLIQVSLSSLFSLLSILPSINSKFSQWSLKKICAYLSIAEEKKPSVFY